MNELGLKFIREEKKNDPHLTSYAKLGRHSRCIEDIYGFLVFDVVHDSSWVLAIHK